jgi:hypothetical protein
VAILTKIMKWIKWEEDLKAFIMWVYGSAGFGKSAIAQTIAEICQEENILLASFFFSRSDPSRNTAKSLIATIAYQITVTLPDVRDAILSAIKRDPSIFYKSLTHQVKSLIVAPLQKLAEANFLNEPTSPFLVVIDGIDECLDLEVQRYFVEVLANAQQQHRLPLIFLFVSRPEQQISLAFSTGILPSITTHINLNEFYDDDNDIRQYLIHRFQEIKSTHRLLAYIPPQWPLPDVLNQLVKHSSGQFIYAFTVMGFVNSIHHNPVDRLNILIKDSPFAGLDALYRYILAVAVEEIEPVLEILSFIFFCSPNIEVHWRSPQIEEFLSLQPGDVELYLRHLNPLVNIGPDQQIQVAHASLLEFFKDPTRSKKFWINPQARHTAFARWCLQSLQFKGKQCRSSWHSYSYF